MEQHCRNSWGKQSDEASRGHISVSEPKALFLFITKQALTSVLENAEANSVLRKH